jgi:uncharacterized membrane protein
MRVVRKIDHEPESAIERVSMNRIEFMRQLEGLLQNIPVGEREEALQYYNDYFDDAGVEREPDVIEALGNPARVASSIQKELYENEENAKKSVKASDRVLANYEMSESEERVPKLYFGVLDDEVVQKNAAQKEDTYVGEPQGDSTGARRRFDPSRAVGSSSGYGDRSSAEGSSSGYGDRSSAEGSASGYGDPSRAEGSSSGYGDRSSAEESSSGYGDPSSAEGSSSGYGDRSSAEESSSGYGDRSSAEERSSEYGEPSSVVVGSGGYADRSSAEGGSKGYAGSSGTDDVIVSSGGRSGTAGARGANGWGNNSVLIAVIIGGVILLPFIGGLLSGIFGGIIGIIVGWFGAILGFGITALALFIASVVLVISGGMMALSNPILGIGLIGGGLFSLGFGFLFLMLTIWMAGTATPWIIRELKKLLDKLYQFIKKNISKVKKWGEQR